MIFGKHGTPARLIKIEKHWCHPHASGCIEFYETTNQCMSLTKKPQWTASLFLKNIVRSNVSMRIFQQASKTFCS